jgi:NADPH:quinone reductase-like Zn-dependent oxidoreductase
MKAIRMHARGGPEELVYENAEDPLLEPGDARVRVMASSLTKDELSWPSTYKTRDGRVRLPAIPGHEFAGIVEAVAPDVRDMEIGSEVYGLASFVRDGSAAEYLAVTAEDLAPRPKSIDFEAAATVPLAGLTAWQALFDHGHLTAGQRLLVHGAAGSVGAFAVQLGRWKGAYVIATAAARHATVLRDLGADEVLDYASVRFEEAVDRVDLVLDTVGGEVFERSRRVLGQAGRLVTIVENLSTIPVAERERLAFFIVAPNRKELVEIGRLIETGRLKTSIAEVFPLEEARKAFVAASKGGKVVLRVPETPRSAWPDRRTPGQGAGPPARL